MHTEDAMRYLSQESDAWVAALLDTYAAMERRARRFGDPAFCGPRERATLVRLTAEALRRGLPLPESTVFDYLPLPANGLAI